MSDRKQCQIIQDLIDAGLVKVITAAVPCGTGSRAREIALPGAKNLPRQLRNAEYPGGMKGVTTDEQLRVDKANLIYDNVMDIFEHALSYGALYVPS